jgi:hypothetical protein
LRKMFHATRISQGFHIPCERAKLWIKSKLEPTSMSWDMHANSITQRLLRIIAS